MNKQTTRNISQGVLTMFATFVILEFYQYDISYTIKWVTTIILIVLNAAYSHWCGLKNGIEMNEEHNKRMEELRKESYNKIVDMVVKEKKAGR